MPITVGSLKNNQRHEYRTAIQALCVDREYPAEVQEADAQGTQRPVDNR